MKVGKIYLYNLENFNLKLGDLYKLKERKIEIQIDLKYPDYTRWFKLNPEIRGIKIDKYLIAEFKKLLKFVTKYEFTRVGNKKRPKGVIVEILGKDLRAVFQKDYIERIWIRNIQGFKKYKDKIEKSFYAVKAIFAIQVESFKVGLQDYEERIVLVKAYDFKEAIVIAKKEFKDYGNAYLNPDNLMVRWKFEKVLDLFETGIYDDKLQSSVTEVFSVLKKRKMKPEYEWHPLKEKKNN